MKNFNLIEWLQTDGHGKQSATRNQVGTTKQGKKGTSLGKKGTSLGEKGTSLSKKGTSLGKKGTGLAEGSWVESRVTLEERRGNHAEITRKSPGNHPLLEGIWKYVAMIFAVLTLSIGQAWGDTAYGFENNNTSQSGYPTSAGDGSRAISSSIKRTGSYSLEQNNNNTSDKVAKVQNLPATFKGGVHYVHSIAYLRKNTSNNVTLKGYSFYAGAEFSSQSVNIALSSDWTRVVNKGQRTGNSQNYTSVEIRYKTNTATKGDKVYIDDIVVYVTSSNVNTDLTAPNSPGSPAATTSSITWTRSTDLPASSDSTGVKGTLIWRRTSGSSDNLTLNNQGMYSHTSSERGPSTDQSGDWTLVDSLGAATTSKAGTFSAGDRYAIVHYDLAYNYSSPTYVTVAAAPSCTNPTASWSTAPANGTVGGNMNASLTTNYATGVVYSSSNTDVATVSGNGASTCAISYVAAGSARITATVTGDGSTYCTGPATCYTDITVSKADISPSLSYSSTTLTVGNNSSSPTVSGNTGSGSVSYAVTSASPAGCITVDSETGVVTAVAAGTGTVTATVAATTNYNGNTCTADFTVNCPAPTAVYVTQTAGLSDVIAGESFTLSAATSTGVEEGATYQWYRNTTPVGTNSPTFTVASCTSVDAGTYWCKITNPCSASAYATNAVGYGIKVWQVLLYSSSWNAYDLTSTGTKTGSLSRQLAPGTYYIKLTHNNGVDFGVNTGETISEINATTPTPWTLYNGQNNIRLNVSTAGSYTFDVDYTSADNPTLSVIYPPATISSCDKIYFCPTQNSIATGSAKFSIYFWNDTEDGWANCYLVDGTEYADDAKYVAFAPSTTNGWKKMIVVRDDEYASSFSGIWNQSQDITYNGYDYIVGTGWSDGKFTNNVNSFYSSTTPAMSASSYATTVGETTNASTNLTGATITYASDNTSVATVNSSGVITGVAVGETTITASVGSCTVGTATVTISRNTPTQYTVSGTTAICSGDNTNITLSGSQTGASYQLKKGGVAEGDAKAGTGNALTWNVSAAGTYTVSAVQTAKYSARDMSGSAVVTVKTPVTASWNTTPADGVIGGSMTASVTTNYSDGLSWESSDPLVATVTSAGVISYVAAGTATITATVTGAGNYCSTASVYTDITVAEPSYGVTYLGSGRSKTSGGSTATHNTDFTATFTQNPYHTLRNAITVTIGGETATQGTEYTWSISNGVGTVTIGGEYITGAIVITVNADANRFSVTHALTNMTTGSGATGANAATYYSEYTATLNANSGYARPATITVTAGATDITANCTWNQSTGAVTIPGAYITGNITITAVGVQVYTVTYSAGASATCKASDTQASAGANIELAEPTWEDHTFLGWYVGDTKIGDAGDDYEPTADITVYGAWKEDCDAGGGGDPVEIKLFDGSTDDDFAASPITVSGVSLIYTAYDKPAAASATDVSSKTNNVNSKNYAKGYQFSNTSIDNGNPRRCVQFTIPSGYTATFTHAFAASGNGRTIMLGSSVIISTGDAGYIATLATTPGSGGSGGIWGGTYSTPLAAGTYYICGAGGGWQVVELIFTLTPTGGGGGGCYYVTYDGNGADGGLTCDPTAYAANEDPEVLDNGDGGAAYTQSGYTFDGWYTKAVNDGTGTAYAPGATITDINDNITLYAQWIEACSSTPTAPSGLTNGATTDVSQVVTWTANGEDTWEVYYNTSSSTPGVDQTPTATVNSATYTFAGLTASTTYYWWARSKCDDSYKSAWVAGTSFTTVAETYTLTATAVTNMTGTFTGSTTITNSPVSSVASGTTIATSDNTFTVGGSTTVTAPETIAGTVEVDDQGTPYDAPCTWRFSKWNNIVTPVAGDESDIEAEYVPTFAINYTLGGGTINEDYPTYYIYTGDEEDEISLPTNVTKANYTFDHWVDAWSDTRSKITCDYWGDFNLTAVWTANQYSVTHTLSNVTTSSGATGANAATYGSDYTAVFAAASSAYELPASVTVTAGGSDITASCTYTKGTGTVVIPGASITGNIVITVTGVYATNFQMVADASAASEQTLTSGDTIKQGEKNCSTLTGGVAVYRNGTNTMKVQKGTPYGWYFGSNGDSIVITMTSSIIKVGSIITLSGNAGASGCGFTFNGSTSITKSDGSSGDMTDSTYTVKAGDSHLIGKNVIVVKRASGSATRLYSLKLSNCQSGTMCVTPVLPSLTTPNQACTTGDFAAWDASVTNAAAISAAAGSQAVSYSWKNSSSVEVATTASYTPTAAGTYTVTATVHSETLGYIDATATSSTLTASLYGNPTVTGPSDAEYVVDESASNLSVTATPTHGESLTYQWYSNTSKSTSSPTPTALENCTTSTYKPSTAAAATTYYFCKVSGGCEDVNSSIATVTVSEPPCFEFKAGTTKAGSGWDVPNNGAITTALWTDGTQVLTGGTLTNTSGSSLGGNALYGLVYAAGDNKQVTLTLTGGNSFGVGTVITITGYSNNTTDACGFTINGNAMSPATYTPGSASYTKFTQTYTVSASDGVEGETSITIDPATNIRVYLCGIEVTGCATCTSITPTLSYDHTTLYAFGGTPREARPTLTGNTGSGAVSYSSSNTSAVTVDSETGVATAVGPGTATVTATIAATGEYCGATKSVDFTVPALVTQTIRVGTSTSWNGDGSSAPDMSFNDPTSTTSQVAVIANSGYTFDATTASDKANMTAKFTGTETTKGSKYVTLKFKNAIHNLRLGEVIARIQPVKSNGKAQVEVYEGSTLRLTSSEVTGITQGQLNDVRFTFASPYVFAANTNIEVRLYFYGQTDGFRLGTPFYVNGSVLVDQRFTDANSTGLWSDPANWDGGSLPEIYHDVVIEKPVVVDIAHATAAAVILDQSSTKTGSLTIQPNKGLEVAGTIRKTADGSSYSATGEADLVLESNEDGNASLIFKNSNSCQATVQMYSKASIVGNTWNWQYVGTPFTGSIPQYNYYGSWMYKWNGGWEVVHGGDELTPFVGYCLTQESATTHVMGGTLVPTTSKSVTMAASTDMVLANSWTAPISIASFDIEGGDATFTSTPATIYLFNTGMAEEGSSEGTEAGTYIAVPINSAPYTGNGLIAPMQGFFVTTNGGSAGSITMNYNDLVRPAGEHTDIVAGPMKAPRRARAAEVKPDVMKIKANGEVYNDRVVILAREDFSDNFDNGWDGEKLSFGEEAPSVYVINGQGGYDAVSAIPTFEGTVVGFRSGANEQCTITFEYDGEETLYLNDLKEETSTLISSDNTYWFYTFDTDSEARFVISATPFGAPQTPTGIDEVQSDNVQSTKARKLLINEHVYIIRGGRMYSVDGGMIK